MDKKVEQDYYSEEYFLGGCDGFDIFKKSDGSTLPPRLSKVISKAYLKKGTRSLDVGCGRGEFVLFLAKNGIAAYGVDYAKAAVKISGELLKKNEPINAHILRSASDYLAFKGNSFDVVFLNDVVEHLYPEQLQKTLEELNRILAPDGQLIIHTMPNAFISKPLYLFIKLIGLSRGPLNPHIHVNEQTLFSLKNYLKNSGFNNLDFSLEFNGNWFRAATAFNKVKFFADPIIKIFETKPVQLLINKTFLKIFFSTDIFVLARCDAKWSS